MQNKPRLTIADIPDEALPSAALREHLTDLEAMGAPFAPAKEGDVWYICYGIARIPLEAVIDAYQRAKHEPR